MKVASYTIIHYGQEYIAYALHSIASVVDVSYVFYTQAPSHDHTTNIQCPENFQDIQGAIKYLKSPHYNIKLIEQSSFRYEGQQRDWAKQFVIEQEKPDYLVVLDYDEIWGDGLLQEALDEIMLTPQRNHVWRVNMTHLWKTFDWHCPDPGWPERIIDVKTRPGSIGYLQTKGPFHFGYCISDEIMRYKWEIHGHKNEMRANWLEDVWFKWAPGMMDVHPTNDKGFWDPEPFDRNNLPSYMQSHPFWNNRI